MGFSGGVPEIDWDGLEVGEFIEVPPPDPFYWREYGELLPNGKYRIVEVDLEKKTITLEAVSWETE